ncbi:hypothetical protein PHYBLDRAFT_59016 [Phycomyces blakesleeanus NRRL 1555(-)]|uniref:Uncharacterized protein n=1 Tax=Phycomyces blakesleeanus (strain ATCC 8743b / DSM 1359 / FGSC 10004 / NBRC 33097 / NRRL 1555) TaxID=763407 RepID=A0A167QNM7_PHYB8|nr:hypothetical protein PHYBLDRAFT_59016 [Phycomyces blakesleeanus NRRL 1555(-)]OAD79971.1 hypothetical protein PHYBLDRAFT_59016 [Phycomyces blakesleeanus NRRL 1555(-)]|eukprot:XP_018298011.1 hypothetical protein PHYBLDRAFT_59016 [Phycomyces blakesleeanus NRRL 1555(-)]
MLLNLLLEKNERIEAMKNSMKNSEEIEEDIATAVKENNDRENIEHIPEEFISSATLDVIRNIFDTYPPDYQYSKGSIYYDSKANLLKHIKAYYRLSIMREVLRDKPFSCFPLQRWLIQCYMKIDTRTLNTLILNYSVISHFNKEVSKMSWRLESENACLVILSKAHYCTTECCFLKTQKLKSSEAVYIRGFHQLWMLD